MVDLKKRCGRCKNCLDLERIRRRVLACCNSPFGHADQGVVDVWNDAVRDYPCTAEDDDAWLDEPERWGTDVDGVLVDKEKA